MVFLAALLALTANPDTLPQGTESHWFDAVGSFRYLVVLPENFNPPDAIPLVVALHDRGSSPDELMKLLNQTGDQPFILAVPQGLYPDGNDRFSWFRGDFGTEEWGHNLFLAKNFVLSFVEQMKREYPVSDVCLLGFSQGGCLSLCTGISSPELFSTVASCNGWLPSDTAIPEEASESLRDVVFYLVNSREGEHETPQGAIPAETFLQSNGRIPVVITVDRGDEATIEAVSKILTELECQ